MIQRQVWPEYTRYLITVEMPEGVGSVQLELYRKPQNFGGTAYIYSLWVDENIRRRGVAKILMDTAERIAFDNYHDDVYLEWSIKESPVEISQWYERRGYDDVEFNVGENASALMRKRIHKRRF